MEQLWIEQKFPEGWKDIFGHPFSETGVWIALARALKDLPKVALRVVKIDENGKKTMHPEVSPA